ncbi:MAG TPA: glycosyltransferase family 2 protein [Anaerolineales bacterium]|nr:glycosyltransferase family 2 protein [Anaerolineales bacterium]
MARKVRPVSPRLSVVVPMFDEVLGLAGFHTALTEVLSGERMDYSIIYVDDGSADGTGEALDQLARKDRHIQVLHLSRNFGHQAALSAGLDAADGDIVVTMDGDGQHPPSLIPELLALHRAGYDVVATQRIDSRLTPRMKRWTAAAFYWTINRLSDTPILPGSADFRLMSRAAAEGLRQMREYHRFLRGMVSWMGFRTVIVPYEPPPRLAGKTKYSTRRMIRLASDAIFSFSLAPLRLGLAVGIGFFLLACLEAAYVLSFWLRNRADLLVPGWSSLMFMILIVGAVMTTLLGFIGIYTGFIFQEVKRRPLYLLRDPAPDPE